jgi:hypothetical protein
LSEPGLSEPGLSEPGLSEPGSLGPALASDVVPLSEAAVVRTLPRLATAPDRDAATDALVDFLAKGFDRVIVFVHAQGQIRGHEGRGADLMLDAVRQVRIPTSGPSMFTDAVATKRPTFAPWPTARAIDRAFAQGMGGIEGNVLMLPVVLRDRVPLLVFAMGTRYTIDPHSLALLAEAVSQSLERIIALRKGTSG